MTPRGRTLLTLGDPNGVGPEIAVGAACELAGSPAAPVVVGDRYIVEHLASRVPGAMVREFVTGVTPMAKTIDVLDVPALAARDWRPGEVSAPAGAATIAYVAGALDALQAGAGSGIVACPHSEAAVNAAGIPFTGYPSLLARLLDRGPDELFVMLVAGGLRIVHATLHERLADALSRLTPSLVAAAARAAGDALSSLGVAAPRIGLFGVNPHAGEKGLFGGDDERVVAPARAELRAAGLDVDGPVGADVLIRRSGYDAFVAMYHDQGHVPVKLLAGIDSSALTVGAGVLFSSVGHGAAFDIAGRGRADPAAVVSTVRLLAADHSTAARGVGS